MSVEKEGDEGSVLVVGHLEVGVEFVFGEAGEDGGGVKGSAAMCVGL